MPLSCNKENSSSEGKRAASSSAAALLTCTDCESRAAKGSFVVPLIGEGLGFTTGECCDGPVGLPRLIGVMSGMIWTACTGRDLWIPITGGEGTLSSGDGSCSFLRVSDCDRFE